VSLTVAFSVYEPVLIEGAVQTVGFIEEELKVPPVADHVYDSAPIPDATALYEPDPPESRDAGPVIEEQVRAGAVVVTLLVH
jgi:hypothetical protein